MCGKVGGVRGRAGIVSMIDGRRWGRLCYFVVVVVTVVVVVVVGVGVVHSMIAVMMPLDQGKVESVWVGKWLAVVV